MSPPCESNGSCSRRLVLLAHGSLDSRWCRTFESFEEKLAVSLGSQVCLAYMEMAAPCLMDAAEAAARDGITELRLLPLFLSSGGHVSRNIPEMAEEIRNCYPEMRVIILPPVGEHAAVVNAMLAVAQHAFLAEVQTI